VPTLSAPRHAVAAAVATATLSLGAAARANGRYPAASLMAFDPSDAHHFVVAATFGLLETRDGGKTFAWRCERAIGFNGETDLLATVTGKGTVVAAKNEGVVSTDDGCSFRSAPELEGKIISDMTVSRSAPHRILAFYTDPLPTGRLDSRIVRTDDDGATWSQLGAPLPDDLLPSTIDIAPSDASRVYVTGRLDAPDDYASVLLRSTDGGETFARLPIPETQQHHRAFIAKVHPSDPEQVWLRVYDPLGTRIWMTSDGGTTFRKVFTGTDQLYGFALSPDGTQMAVGGPSDGIWVGGADGSGLTRRSDVLPNCLGWTDDGVWACADRQKPPFFSIGLSKDSASTFENILRFDALCGQTECAADTRSGMLCPIDWRAIVAPAVGALCGTDAGQDSGGPDAGGILDAMDKADGEIDGMGAEAAPPPPEGAPEPSGAGCSLARSGTASDPVFRPWWLALALLVRRRRDQNLTIT
jgi:photosystem II stability/assembly factor-like uncharacterized protein